ncbi:hypothetical protein [Mycetocola zhadangensis]|uniref:hypothetical protein n=1 Tax=Mycetocola zhadangensis TaxID=1164595 RepID=UPI0016668C41|nr:hypothetical protein [Mycetocola zhadangensis]
MTITLSIPDLTTVLAWIGALTGVAALVWQVATWRKSTHNVKVRAENRWIAYADGSLSEDLVCVIAHNTGSGAVTIENWGIAVRKHGNLAAIRPHPQSAILPHRLEPGASAAFHIEANSLRQKSSERGVPFGQMKPWVRLGTGQRILAGRGVPLKR